MQITYKLTPADFRDGFKAARQIRAVYRWGHRIGVIVLVLVIVCGVILLFAPSDRRPSLIPLELLIIMWVVILWLLPFWSARNQVKKMPAAQKEITTLIDYRGVEIRTHVSDSRMEWQAFTKWSETGKVFTLFLSPCLFHVFPKRAFTPEQMTELRTMLQENVRGRSQTASASSSTGT